MAAAAAGVGGGTRRGRDSSVEEDPLVPGSGVSTKGNLRTRCLPKYQTGETELKVPVAVASVSMDPDRGTGGLTGQQSTNEGGMKSASLKDLCPEDKRRIANLIKELARVSEEKEVTEERLKAEQESFEKKIRQLEEQNELIIKEREALQQQYRECQELLSLYQKYLAEQQEKLSHSLSELSAAKEKEQKVSSKKSLCQQHSLGLDSPCLGVGGAWTLHKNSRAPKAVSPARVVLSQPCRNNHDYRTEMHYNPQECLKEYPMENDLHRKCNNVISPAKQRSPHHVKQAQEMDQRASEFQSTCPQQVSHGCAWRHVGSSGSVEESCCVSQVLRKHSGTVHKTYDHSRHCSGSRLNRSTDSGPAETELAKRLYEERRQKLLLQKMELEIEKERLQHLLTKQEAKLLLKQQQLHQSRMDYNSVPMLKHEDYLLRTSPVSKNSRNPGSSHGSSSRKKMVGFGVNMDDGQSSQMQTKREGTKSGKGTTSGLRKEAAVSPGLMGSSRVPAATAVSPIQHDPSRYQASLLDLVEAMNPMSAPGQLCREPCDRNKPHPPCCASHRLSSSWCQTPCSPRSRADELEESRLLEEIFFI
ncbi:protein hinderin isoform X3 [Onychostruthus taczanowskii]|uniref:protein hinderin isoform X3 n=1 Tax=Onychostruthus taczanowskii TaxID=356909 RepID=UPI001B80CD8E|nr:protein hinderin isoform X3 [Onychostruthus taczanowskii]